MLDSPLLRPAIHHHRQQQAWFLPGGSYEGLGSLGQLSLAFEEADFRWIRGLWRKIVSIGGIASLSQLLSTWFKVWLRIGDYESRVFLLTIEWIGVERCLMLLRGGGASLLLVAVDYGHIVCWRKIWCVMSTLAETTILTAALRSKRYFRFCWKAKLRFHIPKRIFSSSGSCHAYVYQRTRGFQRTNLRDII